jgi:hypothetical protein
MTGTVIVLIVVPSDTVTVILSVALSASPGLTTLTATAPGGPEGFGGITRVSVIPEPGAALAGNAVTTSGRLVLVRNALGGVYVTVVPVCVVNPPPVATSDVLLPHCNGDPAGKEDGVRIIPTRAVVLAGVAVPTRLCSVTVTVCPAESVIAMFNGSTQKPSVVTVNPAPEAVTTVGEIKTVCGNELTTVYGGAPPKM